MIKKVFRSIFLVAILILSLSFLFVFTSMYKYFTEQYYSELKNEAYYVEQGMLVSGREYLKEIDNKTADAHRVTWIDRSGEVLYDSDADENSMVNHADREEFVEAMSVGEGISSRYSDTLAETTLYYAKQLEDGTVLRISATQHSLVSLVMGMLSPLVFILLAAFVLSMILAWRISKRIVKPLNEIDLDHPERVDTYEELLPMLKKITKQNQQIRNQMKELSQRRDEFEMITGNMSEGMLIINPQMEVLSYNNSVLKMLGVQKIQDGQNVLTLNQSDHFRNALSDALEGKQDEHVIRMGTRLYQLVVSPVYHELRLTGALIMILDVTEREEREQLRREFTANVSHELKTPLTSISGFAEIIQNGIAQPGDVPYFAGKIHEEAKRLMALIGDIMRLSQLDENQVEQKKEIVDLQALIATVMKRLQPQADERRIRFELRTEPVLMEGNSSILDEIIYNLMDNAIKYNKERGTVIVTLTKGERILLSVRDTGIGISQADQKRIFERFYRVDKSHSKKVGGTGLGLSIVKHGVAYHKGSIEIDSEMGVGSTITIAF